MPFRYFKTCVGALHCFSKSFSKNQERYPTANEILGWHILVRYNRTPTSFWYRKKRNPFFLLKLVTYRYGPRTLYQWYNTSFQSTQEILEPTIYYLVLIPLGVCLLIVSAKIALFVFNLKLICCNKFSFHNLWLTKCVRLSQTYSSSTRFCQKVKHTPHIQLYLVKSHILSSAFTRANQLIMELFQVRRGFGA